MKNPVKKSRLTDEQVVTMLAQLTEHFDCRVAPVHDYCKGFLSYMHAIRENHKDDPGYADTIKSMFRIQSTIGKSNLLARLIYGGERLRTRKCPIHEGKWSGCPLTASRACAKGCGLTGWIKEPEDGGPPHGSPENEWVCTDQWYTYENGERTIRSYTEMLEYERERERKKEG